MTWGNDEYLSDPESWYQQQQQQTFAPIEGPAPLPAPAPASGGWDSSPAPEFGPPGSGDVAPASSYATATPPATPAYHPSYVPPQPVYDTYTPPEPTYAPYVPQQAAAPYVPYEPPEPIYGGTGDYDSGGSNPTDYQPSQDYYDLPDLPPAPKNQNVSFLGEGDDPTSSPSPNQATGFNGWSLPSQLQNAGNDPTGAGMYALQQGAAGANWVLGAVPTTLREAAAFGRQGAPTWQEARDNPLRSAIQYAQPGGLLELAGIGNVARGLPQMAGGALRDMFNDTSTDNPAEAWSKAWGHQRTLGEEMRDQGEQAGQEWFPHSWDMQDFAAQMIPDLLLEQASGGSYSPALAAKYGKYLPEGSQVAKWARTLYNPMPGVAGNAIGGQVGQALHRVDPFVSGYLGTQMVGNNFDVPQDTLNPLSTAVGLGSTALANTPMGKLLARTPLAKWANQETRETRVLKQVQPLKDAAREAETQGLLRPDPRLWAINGLPEAERPAALRDYADTVRTTGEHQTPQGAPPAPTDNFLDPNWTPPAEEARSVQADPAARELQPAAGLPAETAPAAAPDTDYARYQARLQQGRTAFDEAQEANAFRDAGQRETELLDFGGTTPRESAPVAAPEALTAAPTVETPTALPRPAAEPWEAARADLTNPPDYAAGEVPTPEYEGQRPTWRELYEQKAPERLAAEAQWAASTTGPVRLEPNAPAGAGQQSARAFLELNRNPRGTGVAGEASQNLTYWRNQYQQTGNPDALAGIQRALRTIDLEGYRLQGSKEWATGQQSLPTPPPATPAIEPPAAPASPRSAGGQRGMQSVLNSDEWRAYQADPTDPAPLQRKVNELTNRIQQQAADRVSTRTGAPPRLAYAFDEAYNQIAADNDRAGLAEAINSGDYRAHLSPKDFPFLNNPQFVKSFDQYANRRTFGGNFEPKFTPTESAELKALNDFSGYLDQRHPPQTGGGLDVAAGGGGGGLGIAQTPERNPVVRAINGISQAVVDRLPKLADGKVDLNVAKNDPRLVGQISDQTAQMLPRWLPEYQQQITRAKAAQSAVAQLRSALGLPADATGELVRKRYTVAARLTAADRMSPDVLATAEQALKQYKGSDILRDPAEKLALGKTLEAAERTIKADDLAKNPLSGAERFGQAVEQHPVGGAAVNTVKYLTALFKSGLLFSVRFHTQNYHDAATKNVALGYGLHVPGTDFQMAQKINQYELQPPSSLLDTFAHSDLNNAALKKAEVGVGRVLSPLHGVLGANTAVGHALEQSVRRPVFFDTIDRLTGEALPDLQRQAAQAADAAGLVPAAKAALLKDISATGGQLGPSGLRTIFENHGLTTQQSSPAVRFWADTLGQAKGAGETAVADLHYDYGDRRNLDALAGSVLPFTTWASRNPAFSAPLLATHPYLGTGSLQYDNYTDDYKKAHGLPQRFKDKMPTPITINGKQFFVDPSSLFGFKGQLYPEYAPFNAPNVNQITGGAVGGAAGDVVPGEVMAKLRQLGISPYPWLTALPHAAGWLGDSASNTGTFPLQRLAYGQTGDEKFVPDSTLLRKGYDALKGGSTERPLDDNPAMEYQIRKRAAEIVLETTGKPIAQQPHYLAQLLDPNSDLVADARQQVREDQKFQTGYQFTVPFAQALLSPGEAAIRQSKANNETGFDVPAAGMLGVSDSTAANRLRVLNAQYGQLTDPDEKKQFLAANPDLKEYFSRQPNDAGQKPTTAAWLESRGVAGTSNDRVNANGQLVGPGTAQQYAAQQAAAATQPPAAASQPEQALGGPAQVTATLPADDSGNPTEGPVALTPAQQAAEQKYQAQMANGKFNANMQLVADIYAKKQNMPFPNGFNPAADPPSDPLLKAAWVDQQYKGFQAAMDFYNAHKNDYAWANRTTGGSAPRTTTAPRTSGGGGGQGRYSGGGYSRAASGGGYRAPAAAAPNSVTTPGGGTFTGTLHQADINRYQQAVDAVNQQSKVFGLAPLPTLDEFAQNEGITDSKALIDRADLALRERQATIKAMPQLLKLQQNVTEHNAAREKAGLPPIPALADLAAAQGITDPNAKITLLSNALRDSTTELKAAGVGASGAATGALPGTKPSPWDPVKTAREELTNRQVQAQLEHIAQQTQKLQEQRDKQNAPPDPNSPAAQVKALNDHAKALQQQIVSERAQHQLAQNQAYLDAQQARYAQQPQGGQRGAGGWGGGRASGLRNAVAEQSGPQSVGPDALQALLAQVYGPQVAAALLGGGGGQQQQQQFSPGNFLGGQAPSRLNSAQRARTPRVPFGHVSAPRPRSFGGSRAPAPNLRTFVGRRSF